jgi:hypothetical protein
MKKQTYIIAITISCFGNLKNFYKTFAKGNREVILESIEFEGEPDQHNTGILKEKFVCTQSELKNRIRKYIDENSFRGESFSIKNEKGKEVMTEDNM